ncbi:MAG: hypothetical protein KAH38_05475, partial [Candidatus Hydrogenedentes bacterium]|nr:hypothetical protein [Candidatus Hydrogenedentota bacterium]
MNRKLFVSRITKMVVFTIVCAITAAFALPAAAVTMSDLMKYLPENAQVVVGIPDIQAVEEAGAPLMNIGPLSEISNLAWELGGDTLSEGLTKNGVKAAAPGVVFLAAASENDISVGGVLMVEDEALVKESIAGLLSSEGTEIELTGEIKGSFNSADDVGYFINDGKLFVASSESLLQQLAARVATPAEVNYVAKDEVIIWSRIDILENSNILSMADELAYLKPLFNSLKPFSDEVLVAIGEDAGQAYVRVAARDSSGTAIESPGPLSLHGYMDAAAPVLVNLRIT